MAAAFHRQLQRWMLARAPQETRTTLNQRRIYIVPTRMALAMLGLIVLLFLLAVNFQNALVYAVCFWLLALLVINILHTHRNLSGLSIQALGAESCFAGAEATLLLELSCATGRQKYALDIGWPGQDVQRVNLAEAPQARIRLACPMAQRGRYRFPRLQVETRYPTGLAVAWAHVTPATEVVVYPAPQAQPLAAVGAVAARPDGQQGAVLPGQADFRWGARLSARRYASPLHWGKYAQTGELYSQNLCQTGCRPALAGLGQSAVSGVEMRLSHRCGRCWTASPPVSLMACCRCLH
ncbi:MAG: DUF58 domain-containing protein [Thiolinea sp.]